MYVKIIYMYMHMYIYIYIYIYITIYFMMYETSTYAESTRICLTLCLISY